MTWATPVATTDEDGIVRKGVWVEPIVTKLDFGDAEAGDGSGPDGGFIS